MKFQKFTNKWTKLLTITSSYPLLLYIGRSCLSNVIPPYLFLKTLSSLFSRTKEQKKCLAKVQKPFVTDVNVDVHADPRRSWNKPTVAITLSATCVWAGDTTCLQYFGKPGSSAIYVKRRRNRGRRLRERLRERLRQRNDKLKLQPFSFLCTIKLFELFHLVSISSMSISVSLSLYSLELNVGALVWFAHRVCTMLLLAL